MLDDFVLLLAYLYINILNSLIQVRLFFVFFLFQGRELEAEEIEETEEDDRVKFRDQLQSIGALGRRVSITSP